MGPTPQYRKIDLREDDNSDWIKFAQRGRSRARELLIHAELGLRYAQARGDNVEAYQQEIERRRAQLALIDEIEVVETEISRHKQGDRRWPDLWRKLNQLNQEMVSLCDPYEVRFFQLTPIPPEGDT